MYRSVGETEVGFRVEGRYQRCTLFVPDEKNSAGILFLHGYKSRREGYREYAAVVSSMLGATALTLDIGGHGESEGDKEELTINDHLKEVNAALDLLTDQDDVSPERIGVVGASYGGYLALMASTQRPINRLLLRAPALYPDGLRDTPRGEWNVDEIAKFRSTTGLHYRDSTLKHNENLRATREFEGEILLVKSEQDESIPAYVIAAYDLAAGGIVRGCRIAEIKGAEHSLKQKEKQMFKAHLLGWAAEL